MSKFVCLVAGLVLATCSVPSEAQQIKEGKLVVPERRVQGFIDDGGDPNVVKATIDLITKLGNDGDGSWLFEWSKAGDAASKKAEMAVKIKDFESARKEYFAASNYYSIAGFPEYHSPAEKDALVRHLQVYKKGGSYMTPALEIVKVTARGKTFETFLHKPAGIEKPPIVLWTHGTDKFKGHAYSTVKQLLSMGVAIVTFDLPGTGESTFWPLSHDGEFVHMAVLDAYAKRSDLDTNNIFLVGVSFGGYYATKMAARGDPRLRAVGAICGPVYTAFTKSADDYREILASPEGPTVAAFAHRVGISPDDPEALSRGAARFSLINQGIVGQGRKIVTPLLIANGGRDYISPLHDMKLLEQSGLKTELWTFGMSGHCAREYYKPMVADIVEWLLQYKAQ